MNTGRVLQKKDIQSGHDLTKKHSETSLMAKVRSKINNFEGLEKVCHTFSSEETRHASPRQRTIRKISLLIEYGRAWFVTHIVTHHTRPSHKRSTPHPQPPLFSKKQFSNIYLFPDLTISVPTTLFRRRFNRTFQEIWLTSRPEIRFDSKIDGPLTALMTSMI